MNVCVHLGTVALSVHSSEGREWSCACASTVLGKMMCNSPVLRITGALD